MIFTENSPLALDPPVRLALQALLEACLNSKEVYSLAQMQEMLTFGSYAVIEGISAEEAAANALVFRHNEAIVTEGFADVAGKIAAGAVGAAKGAAKGATDAVANAADTAAHSYHWARAVSLYHKTGGREEMEAHQRKTREIYERMKKRGKAPYY